MTDAIDLAVTALELGDNGEIASDFLWAHAGDGGTLVQIYPDMTYDLEGDPAEGGPVPAHLLERVRALFAEAE